MPDNWRRQALCTDMFYPPEMFPLENELVRQNPFGMHLPTFGAAVTAFRKFTAQERGSMLGRMLSYLIFIVFLYPYVLSVIYRVTFKATSIIYLPFAWATSVRFIFTEGWPFQVKRILEGKSEASRRNVSNFLAIAFACKVLVIYNWVTPAAVIGKIGSEKFAKIFILNDSWPLWQDILLINVAITYCLYWMADLALAMENKLSTVERELTENVFIFLWLFRSYTSIGVIVYLFIINLISLFCSLGVVSKKNLDYLHGDFLLVQLKLRRLPGSVLREGRGHIAAVLSQRPTSLLLPCRANRLHNLSPHRQLMIHAEYGPFGEVLEV
jgi:hypothetical protein